MADNRLQVAELDFDTIKTNLKSYLKQQSEFQDYDFEGSGLDVLINLLAYNTHYNAYYLNMVANEAFLDTALLRDSVVSHAKTLGYVPYSKSASKALINLTVETGSSTVDTVTIPKGFVLLSNTIDNQTYNFNVMADTTVTKSGTKYFFENLEIKEGQFVAYSFTQDESANPKGIFEIPDADVDTNTITVSVRPSSSNSQVTIYNKVTDILDVTSSSEVYFLQEARGGKYKIYFGDDVIGKKINDGAIINITYLSTNGTAANKASSFTVSAAIGAFTNITVDTVSVAAGGTNRETVSEVKYNAVAQFATQNRLVTFKDYESYITKNYPSLDSISVWGGEEETPPVYGKVFISIKPKTDYYISETEKQRILDDIVKAKFILSKMQDAVDATNLNSIIGSETVVRLQKRFLPVLNQSKNYTIKFNAPLHRGTITNKLTSTSFNVLDMDGVERNVIFDEIPQSSSGVTSIGVTDAGTGYISAPTVTITGDGTGATAEAVIVNGRVQNINIVNRGTDYTRAVVTITGGDGYGAKAVAVVDGRVGTLRTIYYDSAAQRQIVDDNVGEIDYNSGTINIYDINMLSVSSADGYIRLSIESEKGIVETLRNTIITIDETDPTSITIDLAKISD